MVKLNVNSDLKPELPVQPQVPKRWDGLGTIRNSEAVAGKPVQYTREQLQGGPTKKEPRGCRMTLFKNF